MRTTPTRVATLNDFRPDYLNAYPSMAALLADEQRSGGIHPFEDLTVVENVDADGAAVPPGEPGARILVTSLFNRVQPLIRLAVEDVMTLDPDPCPCGRTLVRVRAVAGRADDVLHLRGDDGARVAVHPVQFAVVTPTVTCASSRSSRRPSA